MHFKVSPHSHPESPITGSTLETMISRAIELGRTHFAYTDNGYMTSAYKAYLACKAKGIKFAPGLDAYFKDDSCSIVANTPSAAARYFKITLHAHSQSGFEALTKLSSKEGKTVTSYETEFPLFDWKDLEEIAKHDVSACSSDIHDMVSKHVLTGRANLAEPTLLKLKSIFGERYRVALTGVEITHVWQPLVEVKLVDGTEIVLKAEDKVSTNASKYMSVKAFELVEKASRHTLLLAANSSGVYRQINKDISYSKLHEGFLRLPNGDPQVLANRMLYILAKKHSIPVIYTDYSYYATPEDKSVQDVRLAQDGIREHAKRHMQTSDEAVSYLKNKLGLDETKIAEILEENSRWAGQFDNFSLNYDYRIPAVESDKPALDLCLKMVREGGRLPVDNPMYMDRLKMEIQVLAKNGKVDLTPYFLPIRDIMNFYKKNHQLTGPGRGSAAGSLLLYLMGITQVDPIKHELSFERFLSLDRILTGNWPDIDSDMSSRELLVGEDGRSGYLYGRWGDKAAQISTRTMMRLKSSIKDVNRYFNNGKVDPEIEKLSKDLPVPPQGVEDIKFVFGFKDSDGNPHPGLMETNKDLQDYATKRPKEWEVVQRCLGISRQSSKHASAFVIADIPINKVVPTFMGNITQYEAKAVEKAKLIKYDFLVVNQLKDAEICLKMIAKKNGSNLDINQFIQNGNVMDIWNLPEDPAVYESVWNGDTATIFQINTQSMIPFVQKIKPKNIDDLATILALVRPGPLDFVDPDTGLTMADEYIERRNGRGTIKLPELLTLLPETYGVQVYQEQTSKVARQIGMMRPEDAEELRRIFSKKEKEKSLKMKPVFMEGAIKSVGKEKAEMIWAQMETSSRYSFNKSHAVSYAYITYACMYLKYHFPLEWWAAVLSNADESEISGHLFKYVKDLVIAPDVNESEDTMTIDYEKKKIRSKLTVMKGLGGAVAGPIIENRPYKDIKDFVSKEVAGPSLAKKLIHAGVMDSLFPKGHSLLQKMQDYEDAVKVADYERKISAGKKAKEPAKGKVDEIYISMDPFTDFSMKKAILPTLPLDLTELVKKYSKKMNEGSDSQWYLSYGKGKLYPLLDGFTAKQKESVIHYEYSDFAVAGYVVDCKTFSYSKNTRKALKMTIDTDGFLTERVIWPDRETGELKYPESLGKGSVAIFYLTRRPNKEDSSVNAVEVIKGVD